MENTIAEPLKYLAKVEPVQGYTHVVQDHTVVVGAPRKSTGCSAILPITMTLNNLYSKARQSSGNEISDELNKMIKEIRKMEKPGKKVSLEEPYYFGLKVDHLNDQAGKVKMKFPKNWITTVKMMTMRKHV